MKPQRFRRWLRKGCPLTTRKSENLALDHLGKRHNAYLRSKSFPKFLHSADATLPPRHWRTRQSEQESTLRPHRYQSWSPHRWARLAAVFDERLGVLQGRPGLD